MYTKSLYGSVGSEEWSEYRKKNQNFSIMYPASWTIDQSKGEINEPIFIFKNSEGKIRWKVAVFEKTDSMNKEDIVKCYLYQSGQICGNTSVPSIEERPRLTKEYLEINGLKAEHYIQNRYSAVLTFPIEEVILVETENKVYALNYSSAVPDNGFEYFYRSFITFN